MSRTEEQKRRRYLLRVLAQRGPMTLADVQNAVQRTNFATPRRLAALERFGHVQHDADTDTYEITQRGLMRIGKKSNPKNSGAGVGPGSSAPAPVLHIDREVDRLTVEMYGPGALALEVVKSEPDLWESLARALEDGLTPPDLLNVPPRKRMALVEDALAQWSLTTKNGPCQVCGTRVAQHGWDRWSYADAPTEPTFHTRENGPSPLCAWCAEFLASHNMLELRESVGNAIAGTFGIAAGGAGALRYASPKIIPLASEVGIFSATPWGHITGSAAMVAAIQAVAAARVHPSRFVRTAAQRADIRVPGIETPLHPGLRKRREYVPPTVIRSGPSYLQKVSAAERRHDEERAEFLRRVPPAYLPGGRPQTEAESIEWFSMLERQRRELVAIDRQHPTFGDGRPRPKRGQLNPLPLDRASSRAAR